MAMCKDCIHYGICSPYVSPCESFPEVDGCLAFEAGDDVIPKSEVVKILSDLKKELHDKAVYPQREGFNTFIYLKVVDAIFKRYTNRYTNGKRGNAK